MKKRTLEAKKIENNRLLERRSSGYSKFCRNLFHLIRDQSMTFPEFTLYILILNVLIDWDPKHVEYFGSYDLTNSKVASFLGINPSTVCKNEKNLINKGYVYIRSDGRKALKGVGLYLKKVGVKKGGRVGIVNMNDLVEESLVNSVDTSDFDSKSQYFINYELADHQGISSARGYVSHISSSKGVYKESVEDVNIDEIMKEMDEETDLSV